MKPSTETLIGTVERYDERRGGFTVFVPYTDWLTLAKRGYSKCIVQLNDERILSHKQRNAVYALLKAIADWQGAETEDTKRDFKALFNVRDEIVESGQRLISLSDAPMSLVCEFQKFLIEWIIEYDIPTTFDLLKFVDDIPAYMYSCLAHKKCAICGRKADLHHWDRVGMGRDRDEIVHIGMRVMPLCREHHTEAHMIGQKTFDDKYHVEPVELDKSIAMLYGIKTKGK